MLFIDYQNVYRRARDAFFDHQVDRHYYGQVNPSKLGEYLVADSPYDRHLHEVRIYRGLPGSAQDPRGYAAARRQTAAWEQDPRVRVFARPLRYPSGWPAVRNGGRPGEKGIDVALAVDFVAMAVQDQYDVGILFSVDTDLKPALEFVSTQCATKRAEVAAWSSETQYGRLSLGRNRPYCHWLDASGYRAVRDETDYAL